MQTRYQHTLMPVKGDKYPRQVVCFDCDTTGERVSNRPLIEREMVQQWHAIGARYDQGKYLGSSLSRGTEVSSFWTTLARFLKKGTLTWLVLYNAGRTLSLLSFWDMLESGDIYLVGRDDRCDQEESEDKRTWNPGICVIEDPPVIVTCKMEGCNGTLKIIDIRNYGVRSLGNIKWSKDRVDKMDRCIGGMIATLKDKEYGSLRETAGGQALYILRRKFLSHPMYVHTFNSILSLERNAYHGGRCECYHIGRLNTQAYMLDVRSMYCSVAKDNLLPCVPIRMHDHPHISDIDMENREVLWFADCDIETKMPDYPVFVTRSKDGVIRPWEYWNKSDRRIDRPETIYPIGKYRTCLPGPEFKDALVHNRVKYIHSAVSYIGYPALNTWCSALYGLVEDFRRSGDILMSEWAKAMIVAGIGKLGSAYHRWVDVKNVPATAPYCIWTYIDEEGIPTRYRSVAWHTQREETGPNDPESIPSIAAYITSLARLKLLYYIRLAGRKHVYYVDTDSLIVDQEGFDILRLCGEVDGSRIGYLREEVASIDTDIIGIKHYKIGDRVAFAGLAKGSDLPIAGKTSIWEWESPSEHIHKGMKPVARRRLTEYSFRPVYRHGVVQQDGTVKPLSLGRLLDEQKEVHHPFTLDGQ